MNTCISSKYNNAYLKVNFVPEFGKSILSFKHNCKNYLLELNVCFQNIDDNFYFLKGTCMPRQLNYDYYFAKNNLLKTYENANNLPGAQYDTINKKAMII